MLRKTVSAIMIMLILLFMDVSQLSCGIQFTETQHTWMMFHHDPARTGFTLSPAPLTNETLWTFDTGERVTTSPAVFDGKVFIGSMNNIVFAIDQFSGELIWSTQLYDRIFFSSPALGNEKLYIGTERKLYALDIDTGKILWTTHVGFFAELSSPNIVGNKVFICTEDGVFAINSETGSVIWRYPVRTASSVAISDGLVFVSSLSSEEGSYVLALNQNDGTLVWIKFIEGMAGSFVGSPAVSDDRVFVPLISSDSESGFIYAFDKHKGTIIWQSIPIGITFSTPAVAYGKVFVGSYDGNIYAFNETNGELIWSYKTDDRIQFSSPAIASGMVFIGSDDNYVYCLNESNGKLIWKYKTEHCVVSSPAISDGILYIGSIDGKIYAIATPVPTTVDIKPDTLNLKSRVKWVIAYIELPEGYNVSDINVSSILLNNTIPVDLNAPMAIGDYDNDTIPDLMVKFNGTEVIKYILNNTNVTKLVEERFLTITLTLTGKLNDGTWFQGSDTIRIIMPIPRGIGKRIFPI